MGDSTKPDERDQDRRRRWLLWIFLLLILLIVGFCTLLRSGEEVSVDLVVFGEPLGERTVVIDLLDVGELDAAPVATHTFEEPGEALLSDIDTARQLTIVPSPPNECESVAFASGAEQDLALGDGWDIEEGEFEGGTTGTVVVVCGGYFAETVFQFASTEEDLPADIELWFQVAVDPENPELADDVHEGVFSSSAPATVSIQPGVVEISIVGDPASGQTVDEVLSDLPGGPCRLVSPQSLSLGEVGLQQSVPIDVEVSCDGGEAAAEVTTTTVPAASEAAGKWIFRVHVTGVEGSVCQGEIGERYEREVTISGPDEALVVIGLDDLDDPRDPAWVGSYSAGKLVFGGTRAEDDGLTTATFEMTLSGDGSVLDGSESWTWDWTSRGETGTCTEGTSTVSASRVP